MKTYYLAFEIGSLQKTIYPLFGPTTIGRSSDNTISLPDPTASRHHAKVSYENEVWLVADLGSANGILHQDKRVRKAVLRSGDTFRIGGITFRFIEKEIDAESNQLFETVQILTNATEAQNLTTGAEDLTAPKEGAEVGQEKECEELGQERQGEETKPWSQRLQDAVGAIPFFSSLEEAARKKLVDTASVHVLNAGETIIREGDPGRSIYVVLNGQIRVFNRDHHGEELELAVLGVSEFFGEMSFLTGKPRSSSVVSLDTSVLMELSYTSMRKLVREHPSVKKTLLEYYHHRREDSQEKPPELGMEKRRSESRLRKRMPVKLSVLPQDTPTGEVQASSWTGASVDISLAGIVVAVPNSVEDTFRVGGRVRLEIELPQPWGEIRSIGVVRRIKTSRTEKQMILVALEYEGISTTETDKLDKFLHGQSQAEL